MRPPRLSQLNMSIFNMELTHFGSEASNHLIVLESNNYAMLIIGIICMIIHECSIVLKKKEQLKYKTNLLH